MIVGVVSQQREAVFSIIIRGADGEAHEIEAIINTGFTGFLTLPSHLVG